MTMSEFDIALANAMGNTAATPGQVNPPPNPVAATPAAPAAPNPFAAPTAPPGSLPIPPVAQPSLDAATVAGGFVMTPGQPDPNPPPAQTFDAMATVTPNPPVQQVQTTIAPPSAGLPLAPGVTTAPAPPPAAPAPDLSQRPDRPDATRARPPAPEEPKKRKRRTKAEIARSKGWTLYINAILGAEHDTLIERLNAAWHGRTDPSETAEAALLRELEANPPKGGALVARTGNPALDPFIPTLQGVAKLTVEGVHPYKVQ